MEEPRGELRRLDRADACQAKMAEAFLSCVYLLAYIWEVSVAASDRKLHCLLLVRIQCQFDDLGCITRCGPHDDNMITERGIHYASGIVNVYRIIQVTESRA